MESPEKGGHHHPEGGKEKKDSYQRRKRVGLRKLHHRKSFGERTNGKKEKVGSAQGKNKD